MASLRCLIRVHTPGPGRQMAPPPRPGPSGCHGLAGFRVKLPEPVVPVDLPKSPVPVWGFADSCMHWHRRWIRSCENSGASHPWVLHLGLPPTQPRSIAHLAQKFVATYWSESTLKLWSTLNCFRVKVTYLRCHQRLGGGLRHLPQVSVAQDSVLFQGRRGKDHTRRKDEWKAVFGSHSPNI